MIENTPLLTVRVVKAKPHYWYANQIGQTFRAFRAGDYYFILDYEGMFDVDDCEVVE